MKYVYITHGSGMGAVFSSKKKAIESLKRIGDFYFISGGKWGWDYMNKDETDIVSIIKEVVH